MLLQLIDGQIDDINTTPKKENNKAGSKVKIPEHISNNIASKEILTLLEKMSKKDRTLLIKYLMNNNLPLESGKIRKLISYLQKNSNNNNDIIKAFIMLAKNNIPVSKGLLEGMAANLNQENSLSQKLNNLLSNIQETLDNTPENTIDKKADNILQKTGNNNKSVSYDNSSEISKNNISKNTKPQQQIRQQVLTNFIQADSQPMKKDNLLLNIIKQLIVVPSESNKVLVEQLQKYPQRLSNSMEVLQEQAGNNEQKILQQLIGQQILNHQDKSILLNLEIPLYFPQYKKFIPAYLNIKEDDEKYNENNISGTRNYKIQFIISLEKRGIIKSETFISKGRIKILFTCNKQETADLIKKEFISVKEGLENIGMNVEKPIINYANLQNDDINQYLNDNTGLNNKNKEPRDFLHIDIKV